MLQDDLVVGPLRIDLRELETRSIRAAGVELVRRAYFAVRDQAWGTLEPEILARDLERHDGGFRLQARCRYRADAIHLDAEVEISATDDGIVRFVSTTVATSAFGYNRIGFCLHHPPAELTGATLLLDGTETIEVPRHVLPQLRAGDLLAPAAGPFSSLTVTGASGARIELRFGGDEFELEDQRNWTDGSFKTYGPPLVLGPPPPLAPGDRLTQSIELRLLDPPRRRAPSRTGIPELRFAAEAATPRIGFAAGSSTSVDGDLVRLARPAHLRVDLRDGRAALERTLRLASVLEGGVQLGLHLPLTDAEREDLGSVAFDGRLRSVLVLHREAELLTDAQNAESMRELLGVSGGEPRLWTGTDAYYAQLNRGLRPGLGTCLTFSMHPQEHASDEESLVETLEIQRDVVCDLKVKQPGCCISLGAVTVGRRRNFSAPPGVAVADPVPDPRQSSLFGAAWSLASVRYLSDAGVDEVSYHTLSGVGGLIDCNGRATPLLHLFADLAEIGDRATILESTAPLRCAGLAFRSAASHVMLVGNLRAERLLVRLPLSGDGHIRRLNDASLATATAQPTSFRADRGAWRGEVLELEPHEYVRLEVGQ